MYIGAATVNFETNVIDGPNGSQYVEPKIMRLLKHLADNPNTVLSREELITAVWGVNFGGDERLSRAISLLRKALGEEKGRRKYIKTISRGGYQLIAEVSAIKPDTADVIETTTQPRKKAPLNWFFGGLVGAALSAILIFFAMPQRSTVLPTNNLPVSQLLSEGFDGIQFFGHAGAIEKSQQNFATVLQEDPDNAAAHAGLALAYIREFTALESDPALLKQSRASALNALEKNEHLALSHIAMGWSAEFQKETDKALQYLERADLLDKNNPLILESRIRILASMGKSEDAKALIKKSIDLHPDVPQFHSFAVYVYSSENDLINAEIHGRKSIDLDPENPWAYSSTAQILHLQNRTTDAIKTIQSGLEIQESASLYNNLGTYLFFEGYYEMAASAYEKTLSFEGNSHDPLFWANLGDAYRWVPGKKSLSEEKYKRAIQLWESSIESNPDNLTLRTRLALYKAKLKSGEKPEALIEKIGNSDGLESVMYYRTLVTAELWGDRKKSLNLLEKSIDAGYPLNEIRNDPELQAMREDQDYHLIVSK